MKTFVTLLSITCLVVLGVATAPAPVHAESEAAPAPAPSPDALLEELFGTAEEVGSCTIVDCSNTGNIVGYGNTCQQAKDDLEQNIYDTATAICNGGLVTEPNGPSDINFGSCTLVARGQYRYNGNADVFCKLCHGQVCTPYT